MNIYITDKDEVRTVRLFEWDIDSQRWSSDFFSEISNTAELFPISREDSVAHDAGAAMTDAEYGEEVAWWADQVKLYNAHDRRSWFTEDMDEDEVRAEFAKGKELCFMTFE